MSDYQAFLLITGSIIITQGLRYTGLSIGAFLPNTGRMGAFLDSIPIAILTALVAPAIFNGGPIVMAAAMITAIIAYVTNNMLVAMICGIVTVVILRQGILF